MKRTIAALTLALAAILAAATMAVADPQPPTNGGNGAGQSGQCTGPADQRPTSCQSP